MNFVIMIEIFVSVSFYYFNNMLFLLLMSKTIVAVDTAGLALLKALKLANVCV